MRLQRCGRLQVHPVALLGLALGVLVSAANAADWPQWRGPQRNGISAETGLLSQWPGSGPRKLWSAQVGEGFSSVAVTGGKLYTMGNDGRRDTVYCLNATTGKAVWKWSYPAAPGDYSGPRATPTVDGNRVFIMSREAGVACLDAATGKFLWGRELTREVGGDAPGWGFTGSPLIEGNLVIFNVGSAGVALNKQDGKVVWKSRAGQAGYASPVAFAQGGQRGVALFTAYGLVAVNAQNGRPLWQYPWETSYGVNAADPIFIGTDVFISSNYGKGCALVRTAGGRPAVSWQNRNMKNHFNSCVLWNGYLYGNDENTLKCIDYRTGQERWRLRGMDRGGLIVADGKLIVLAGDGELFLAAASPDRYTELARAKVMGGTCWTHPVLANGLLYCRSHEGELICLDLRGR